MQKNPARQARNEQREKREQQRKEQEMKRDTKRKEGRTATRGAALMAAFMVATVMLMTGCQNATPSATSNDSDIRDSQVVINNTVNIYPVFPTPTNAIALTQTPVALPSMTFTISDVMGTQSTSAEGGSNSQDMTPTMTPGITGDKPIEEIGSTVRSGLSAGATDAVTTAADTVTTLSGSSKTTSGTATQ